MADSSNKSGKSSMSILESDRRELIAGALFDILSTEIAQCTFAQIVDGLPLPSVLEDTYLGIVHWSWSQTIPCWLINNWRRLRAMCRVSGRLLRNVPAEIYSGTLASLECALMPILDYWAGKFDH